MSIKNGSYVQPSVKTVEARRIVETLGPVSAGSGQKIGPNQLGGLGTKP